MSDILSKDRNPLSTRLHAESLALNLSADIVNMVNNEEKMPRRKREFFGKRLVDNAINCAESIRAANNIILNITNYTFRRNKICRAIDFCYYLQTDLSVLYKTINLPPKNKVFINELFNTSDKLLASLINWLATDDSRYNKMKAEQDIITTKEKARKTVEYNERRLLSERRLTKGIIIPFYFVDRNLNIIGDAANTDKQINDNRIALGK